MVCGNNTTSEIIVPFTKKDYWSEVLLCLMLELLGKLYHLHYNCTYSLLHFTAISCIALALIYYLNLHKKKVIVFRLKASQVIFHSLLYIYFTSSKIKVLQTPYSLSSSSSNAHKNFPSIGWHRAVEHYHYMCGGITSQHLKFCFIAHNLSKKYTFAINSTPYQCFSLLQSPMFPHCQD